MTDQDYFNLGYCAMEAPGDADHSWMGNLESPVLPWADL